MDLSSPEAWFALYWTSNNKNSNRQFLCEPWPLANPTLLRCCNTSLALLNGWQRTFRADCVQRENAALGKLNQMWPRRNVARVPNPTNRLPRLCFRSEIERTSIDKKRRGQNAEPLIQSTASCQFRREPLRRTMEDSRFSLSNAIRVCPNPLRGRRLQKELQPVILASTPLIKRFPSGEMQRGLLG